MARNMLDGVSQPATRALGTGDLNAFRRAGHTLVDAQQPPFEIDRFRYAGSGRLVRTGAGGAVDASVRIGGRPRAERRAYLLSNALVDFRGGTQ
jgi:hypothetical protein